MLLLYFFSYFILLLINGIQDRRLHGGHTEITAALGVGTPQRGWHIPRSATAMVSEISNILVI